MENLVKITTNTGLELYADPAACDDMELLDSCYEVQENDNMLALPAVLRHLLTEDARKALYAHIKATYGRVRLEPLMQEVMDIMGKMAESHQATTPAPTPEPEPLFPGPGPLPPFDKTQPPPAWHVDNVMARLHGALHNSPGQADKLEKVARTALDAARPSLAWDLLDKLDREIRSADNVRNAQAAPKDDPAPAEDLLRDVSDALVGSIYKSSTSTPPGSAVQDGPDFTPWDDLKADTDSADEANSAAE